MRFLKLLVVALLVIDAAVAQEPAGIAAPAFDDGSQRPSGKQRPPGSVLDPPPGGAGYRFAMAREPRPGGWSLVLGALLSGGFIVRRRLSGG